MCHDLSGPITESSLRSSLRELRRMVSSTEGEEQRATNEMPLEPIFKIAAGNSYQEIPRNLAIDVLELHHSIQAKHYLKTIIFADDIPFLLRSKAVGALARSISLRIWPEIEIEIEAHLLWKQTISEFAGRLLADGNTVFTNAGQNNIETTVKLELLQAASRAVQLDAGKSSEMPILGQDKDFRVQMLTLTVLQENTGLRVQAKLIEPRVWKLQLPHSGGRLEFVVIPGGQYPIGSPLDEKGRGRQAEQIYRQTLGDYQDLDIEKIRSVSIEEFAMTRYPITQNQWESIASLGKITTSRDIDRKPTSFSDKWTESLEQSLGFLPVNNVNWHDCQEWLSRINEWLYAQWKKLGTATESPTLRLPTEDQWEVACRGGSSAPFHFGESFHENWVNCNKKLYPLSFYSAKFRGTLPVGFSGVVNQLGLSDMHGQVYEWCENDWGPDPTQFDDTTDRYRPGRGGSWRNEPELCRSAFRPGFRTNYRGDHLGFRVCCSLPAKSE